MLRLAIFATHPIQYQVPWFQALSKAEGIEVKVYYSLIPDAEQQGQGFGVSFVWDIPMFSGYSWEVLENKLEQPKLTRFFGSRIRHVRTLLKNEKPDVVLITGWNAYPLLQVLLACIWLGIPRLVRGDSNSMRARPLPVRFIHSVLMKCYSAFLFVGQANRRFYKNYRVKDHQLFSVPHFVDNQRFSTESKKLAIQRDNLRQKWRVPSVATCFLYAGKLSEKKRITDLLSALSLIWRTRHAAHLLVVGDGELMAMARTIVNDNKLPVTFCGFLNQSEMAQAYVATDCLVLPSDYGETWGLVVNEAMACGLPAIVSDRVGCGPDLVHQGITGFRFPFGDIERLAESMIAFIALSEDQRHEMGSQAQRLVSEEYSIDAAVKGTINAVVQVCGAV
jgi:glycosyltransferase involved in cell wall biosynthesis